MRTSRHAALLHRRPPGVARLPMRGLGQDTGMFADPLADPLAERPARQDPRGGGDHSTLDYRIATELLNCIRVLGPAGEADCRHEILGIPIPEFRSVAGITSPVPFRAAVAADGSASARLGGVAVRIEPDQTSTDPALTNRAETRFSSNVTTPSATTMNGRVNGFTLASPEATITIHTVYGPGTSPGGTSGYGRGTTAADQASGDTSLGFHESQHGVDFLRYMANVPQPRFAGARGMTVPQFQAAQAAYQAVWNHYFTEMEHRSVHHTDCVGSTASASAQVQTVCTHAHTPVPNP